MDCFSNLTGHEMELVHEINEIDFRVKDLKRKIADLNKRRKEIITELGLVRLDMKNYLENELGVKTEN